VCSCGPRTTQELATASTSAVVGSISFPPSFSIRIRLCTVLWGPCTVDRALRSYCVCWLRTAVCHSLTHSLTHTHSLCDPKRALSYRVCWRSTDFKQLQLHRLAVLFTHSHSLTFTPTHFTHSLHSLYLATKGARAGLCGRVSSVHGSVAIVEADQSSWTHLVRVRVAFDML
jgi:hypothetical protein